MPVNEELYKRMTAHRAAKSDPEPEPVEEPEELTDDELEEEDEEPEPKPKKKKKRKKKSKRKKKKPPEDPEDESDLEYDDVIGIDEELTISEWKDRAKLVKSGPHLIENLLASNPGDYGIITGRTGLGKTNTCFNIGYCLATGTPYFHFECAKVGVSMICFEGGHENLKERIGKIEDNFPPVENRFHFRLSREDTAAEIHRRMELSMERATERGDRVIIIDPIKYLISGDYLDTKDAEKFTRAIKKTLKSYGLTLIFVLPIRKPPSFKGLITMNDVYSVKGATEWVDNANFVLLVEWKPRSREYVVLGVGKHRVSRIGHPGNVIAKFNSGKCMFERVFVDVDDDGKIDGNI